MNDNLFLLTARLHIMKAIELLQRVQECFTKLILNNYKSNYNSCSLTQTLSCHEILRNAPHNFVYLQLWQPPGSFAVWLRINQTIQPPEDLASKPIHNILSSYHFFHYHSTGSLFCWTCFPLYSAALEREEAENHAKQCNKWKYKASFHAWGSRCYWMIHRWKW